MQNSAITPNATAKRQSENSLVGFGVSVHTKKIGNYHRDFIEAIIQVYNA